MDRADAINWLPPSSQFLLLLVAWGWSEDEIVRQLGVDTGAVRPLIDLADAKLARLTDTSPSSGSSRGTKQQ